MILCVILLTLLNVSNFINVPSALDVFSAIKPNR